jgi:alpha-L-glutamate ligase-like protein
MIELVRRLRDLRRIGVLGMNRRNGDYILRYNRRHMFPLVDDKLQTKRMAQAAGVAVPELYAVLVNQHDARTAIPLLRRLGGDFVLKPAHGSGGDGIMVFTGTTPNKFRKISGELVDDDEVRFHCANIVSGMYSFGGYQDVVIVEQRIQFDPLFEPVSYLGVPDLRIIVFLGVPVMAMVRLPTRESDGKANLHQGAVGAGLDLATGITLSGVCHDKLVDHHPDTGALIAGIRIPGWQELLAMAVRCAEGTGLGYVGTDLVLDRNRGPVLLELNARPGLNIQLANLAPLLPRLQRVEACRAELGDLPERIRFAMDEFADGNSRHLSRPPMA